ncbi:MAG TPA: hypothetical protein DDX92_01245 [Flavobacteriales bacterium]|nr:hypothetical protein [Flavobacteriales bacterium]
MQMGIVHDNYNTTENVRLNPALSVDPLPWLDIHVVGFYGFVANNFAYLPRNQTSILRGQFPDTLQFDLRYDRAIFQGEALLLGPAFNLSLGQFSIGLSLAQRNYAIGRQIPQEVARGMIYGFQQDELYGRNFETGDFRIKSLSWGEIGVNVGMIAYQSGNDMIKAGLNFKYLFGLGSAYLMAENINYTVINDSVTEVYELTGEYGGSSLGFYPGTGWGLDLGVVYEKKLDNVTSYVPHSRSSGCRYTDYLYRFGISILDIGRVRFSGAQSYQRRLDQGQLIWNNYDDFRPNSIEEAVEGLDERFAPFITEATNTYNSPLPTSISAQFDYNMGYGLYVNATAVYGFRYKRKYGAERMHLLAVTPRYESRRFGASIPFSMNEALQPGIGASIRFWYLTVGTDSFIPWFFNIDVKRLDAYFHIKIPILTSPECRAAKGKKWSVKECTAPGYKTSGKKVEYGKRK